MRILLTLVAVFVGLGVATVLIEALVQARRAQQAHRQTPGPQCQCTKPQSRGMQHTPDLCQPLREVI